VERYNESPHRGLFNLTPYDVYKKGKVPDPFRSLKNTLNNTKPTRNLLKVGERVRIARLKNNIFEKSSLQRWVKEKFYVTKVFIKDPVTYELQDKQSEKIEGVFYREELQKV
jgi:thioredoxin-related protein